MTRLAFGAALLLACLAALGGARAAPPPAIQVVDSPKEICRALTYRAERREGIPGQLLSAISLVETGRWDPASKENFAWPWTVTAGGEGKYFPTEAEAIAEVRRLQDQGVRNIDVGCMQVNLLYHPEAFATLEAAFDPETNVAYAAGYLMELYGETRSWYRAAAHYHSTNKELNIPYRRKLMRVWDQERRHAGDLYRARALEAYRERQQRRERYERLEQRINERHRAAAPGVTGAGDAGHADAKSVSDYLADRNRSYRHQGYPRFASNTP